jgi:uncharacterized protein (TIRG00374 family)
LSRSRLSLWASTRLILSASTLNLVLPSKMGDIAKAFVLTNRYGYNGKLALIIVVLEKLLDFASLLIWGVAALVWVGFRDPVMWLGAAACMGLLAVLALLLAPTRLASGLMAFIGKRVPGKIGQKALEFSQEWTNAIDWFWSQKPRAFGVIALSVALWAAHLAQFWLFSKALGAAVPFIDNMAFATLSILVGLAPFTMAGMGTRDAAIIFFYRLYLSPGQGAVLGVLATARYLIPALAGLPFIKDYMPKSREKAP